MKGITVSEQAHVVNILPPIDINGAGFAFDYYSLKNYAHASIILTLGSRSFNLSMGISGSADSLGSRY